jgi:hypothetical protein
LLLQEAFLSLIYTNTSPDLDEHAGSLLVLGEKYQIPDIKGKALEVLRKKMCPANVGDLLTLADLHNAPELKEDVIDYIIGHWDQVRETEAWKDLRTTNSFLVDQIIDRMQTPKKLKTTSGATSQR